VVRTTVVIAVARLRRLENVLVCEVDFFEKSLDAFCRDIDQRSANRAPIGDDASRAAL